jgi:RHS repeat-associated protein
MLVPNRHESLEDYRYGFNGMEKDDELKGEGNSYDYGARMLDSRVGRFLSLDPLENVFPFVSPYVYALNNPIYIIDFDGKKPDPIIIKYIQIALNNMPKIKANKEFQDLRLKVYGESKYTNRVAATLNDKKYLYKKSTKGILKNNKHEGETTLDFYGMKLNVNYSLFVRDDLDKFSILEFDWKGNKEGPYLYGGGKDTDSESGYYLEMNNSISSGDIRLLTVQFDDFESMEKAKYLYSNEYKKELEKLLNTDPLIKEYVAFTEYYQKEVMSSFEKSIANPKNEKVQKEYSRILEVYKKKYAEFEKKRKIASKLNKKG